jgi:phage baseplate assembly protein W
MGSITFNNLKNTNVSQKRYTYVDMTLDLAQEPFESRIGGSAVKGSGKDIKVSYDLNAIRNSIVNLFNTTPGDRILMPDYGCSLRNFIFNPISETTSRLIGRNIKTAIEQWEPRVTIVNINIDSYESRQEYVITLVLQVPFLQNGQTLDLTGIFNRQGFRL